MKVTEITSLKQCKTNVDFNLFFDFLMDKIKDKDIVTSDIRKEDIEPLNSIFAKISHYPLDYLEQQEYTSCSEKVYNHLEKTITLNLYYNAILTFAISQVQSTNHSSSVLHCRRDDDSQWNEQV